MSVVLQVIVRAVVVLGLGLAVGYLMNLATPPGGGANIGAGLASFAVILVASVVWSFLDGRRTRSICRVIGIWAVVALLVALAMVLQIQVFGAGFDVNVLRSDLLLVAPFQFGLVFVPAAVGAVLGSLLAPKAEPAA